LVTSEGEGGGVERGGKGDSMVVEIGVGKA
jgi:hypothetical protein